MQKGHALVAEELVIAAVAGTPRTVTELARNVGVNKSVASRTVTQLTEWGLVERSSGRQAVLHVADLPGLADLLAERTAWPGRQLVSGYSWGRTIWDTAATVPGNAADAGIEIAITGRGGSLPGRARHVIAF